MESIRILQDTYEKLYVLSEPIRAFLEERLPCVAPNNWKKYCVYDVLNTDGDPEDDKDFSQLDVYYLVKVLLADRNWNALKELFPGSGFYTESNKKLLKAVKRIRNKVAHPQIRRCTENDYIEWTHTLDDAARLFGKNLHQLIADLHENEKENLLEFIFTHSTNITMSSPKYPSLSEKTRKAIEETKERLKLQTTAAGIMALFEDAYFLGHGSFVRDELNAAGLPTFEDIMEKVQRHYYGFSK